MTTLAIIGVVVPVVALYYFLWTYNEDGRFVVKVLTLAVIFLVSLTYLSP